MYFLKKDFFPYKRHIKISSCLIKIFKVITFVLSVEVYWGRERLEKNEGDVFIRGELFQDEKAHRNI